MHDFVQLKNALYNVQKMVHQYDLAVGNLDEQALELLSRSSLLVRELKPVIEDAIDDRYELIDALQNLLDHMEDQGTTYNPDTGEYYDYVEKAARVLEQAGGHSPFSFEDEENTEEL